MTTAYPPTLSTGLAPGSQLHEYTLLKVLGIGGFGITYLARDNHLQLDVAIKEFFPASLAVRNPATGSVAVKAEEHREDFAWGKSRFMGEAQMLARFRHENIVQVFRFFDANDTSYMVMAYEEGTSLEELLKAKDDWDEASVQALLLPLLDGLQAVHGAGFLHRDIKPANILVRARNGAPVLIDFGSARSAISTHTLTALVSPGYGPVEQYFEQGHQGPWTDIYALSAVLYRIVCGVAPVPAHQRLKKDALVPAVFAAKGDYSPTFLKAIDAALHVDEAQRPQSIAEWRQLQGGAAAAAPGAHPLAGAATRPGSAYADASAATTTFRFDATERVAGRRAPTRLLAVGGILIGALAAVVLWPKGQAERPAPVVAAVPAVAASAAPAAAVAVPPAAVASHPEATTKKKEPTPTAPPRPAAEAPATAAARPAPAADAPARPAPAGEAPPAESPARRDAQPMPPPEAANACNGKTASSACEFVDRDGLPILGTCVTAPFGGRPLTFCRPGGGRSSGAAPGAASGRADLPPGEPGLTGPTREALIPCQGRRQGDACSFIGRRGETLTGTCISPPPMPNGGGEMPMACRPSF